MSLSVRVCGGLVFASFFARGAAEDDVRPRKAGFLTSRFGLPCFSCGGSLWAEASTMNVNRNPVHLNRVPVKFESVSFNKIGILLTSIVNTLK